VHARAEPVLAPAPAPPGLDFDLVAQHAQRETHGLVEPLELIHAVVTLARGAAMRPTMRSPGHRVHAEPPPTALQTHLGPTAQAYRLALGLIACDPDEPPSKPKLRRNDSDDVTGGNRQA